MFIFRWEPTTYQSSKSAAICDIEGHRLYVKRSAKRARTFNAFVDGRRVPGTFNTIDLAKEAAQRELKLVDGVSLANAEGKH